ncbi:MAG: hypothetical protein WDO17_14135 [Alphaproteobacteria bacterium]
MQDLSKLGRELFDGVRREEGAKEQAEFEGWYQDYHHWNHFDAEDRARGAYTDVSNASDSLWFRLFRNAMGLRGPSSVAERYRIFRFFRR